MSVENRPCTKQCVSTDHGELVLSALTKRGVSDGELCAYLNQVCEHCGTCKDLGGRTPLHMAASCGRTEVCKWLICQKRARIDAKDTESGYTALHRSVFYGKIDTAVALIKLGANINTLDCNNLTPIEHAAEDNNTLVLKTPNTEVESVAKLPPAHFVYVWGSNYNYTLGPQQFKAAQILDAFHKKYPYANISSVCLEKFHTLILSTSGEVYSFGLGQGGRLGLGSEKSIVEPTAIKFGQAAITMVSAARDHSMFLTDTGNVYICGLNTHNVLGIQPPPPHLLTPALLSNSNFKDSVTGVCCGRYHSVLWTKKMLYTWGLHAGQLGHSKNPGSYIITPKSVPFTSTANESDIIAVAASAGATAVATSRGDIYVLHEFQIRRIASRELLIKSLSIIGGKLAVDNNEVEVTKSELKVVVLTEPGNILIWQESDPQLSRCVFSLNRLIHVRSVCLNSSGLFFLTCSREIFNGKLKLRKKPAAVEKKKEVQDKNAKVFHKFLDRNDCVMVQVSKVHRIYGADYIASDSEGENFAALQINIARCIKNPPTVSPSTMLDDFKSLILKADVVEDVNFNVNNKIFPAHKFIVANSSDKLHKMIVDSPSDTVKLDNVQPEIFEQILKYMYTNMCDLLREGVCPETLLKFYRKKTKTIPQISSADLDKSAFEVYRELSEESSKEKKHLDPVRLLQESAKTLGVTELYKDLSCFVFSNGRIKMKVDKVLKMRALCYDHEKFSDYYDVVIKTKNGITIEAHRCVLAARNAFFNHMFSDRWIQGKVKSQISLQFPRNTLKHLISYLYTDNVNLEDEDVDGLSNLLVLADHILLSRLIEICESYLVKLISMKTLIKLLTLSYYYNAVQLKRCCMEYLCMNLPVILEDRSLEQIDEDIVKDLTKFYSEWNAKMAYRVITPFSNAASDEVVKKSNPVNMNFEEEIVKGVKTSQRKRNRSHKISFSEKLEVRNENIPPETVNDGELRSSTPVIATGAPTRVQAIIAAQAKLNDSVDAEEFVSIIDNCNDFPDLNKSFSGSDIYSKSPNKHEKLDWHKLPKISQKQRKRLSSENGLQEVIPEIPKNPWKIVEPVSPVGSPLEKVTINAIITEEKKQRENLVKIRSKLLVHTQMEDKALEELKKFYNIDNVFDEIIIAERVQIGMVAAPVWVQR